MRRSFGCISIPAFFSALTTLLVIAGAVYVKGGSLFSAGALNAQPGEKALGGVASHQEIGGDCKACHTAPWSADTMADRCVVCHTQISAELNTNNGLHGIFLQAQTTPLGFQFPVAAGSGLLSASPKGRGMPLKCNACHPDHRGAHAALVEMDLANFPHDKLKFSLRAHRQKTDGNPFACADCHAGEYTGPFDVSTCVTCHYIMQADFTQAHALEFGLDCLNCHDGLETFGSNFDHNLFQFQLAGLHAQAACAKCHPNARTVADLQSAPQDCFSCHQQDDDHAGLFGTNCAVCHTSEAWIPAKIDHNLSKFPLEGRHSEVACEKCHTNNVFAGTPQECFSCHKQNDKHNGQLGITCEACHSPAGWDQFHINHSLFAFPLTGAHVNAACETCHQNGVYKGTSQDCYSCHKKDEPHGGRLGTSCATCHSTNAWKPAKFNHNLAAFKLTGAHVKISCTNCHQNDVYKGTPRDCYSCHQKNDNHKGQFGTSCATCHSTSAWKPASFDHNLSVFKLTGAHVKVSCTNCHQNGVFKGTPQDCYSCHQKSDNHKGQFGTSCATCHSTSAWKPATFDHNLSVFKLTGAHVNVSCTNCHQNGVFKGTPQDCYSCHQKDDNHQGLFGTNCAVCHTSEAWIPAKIDHNLSKFPLEGKHTEVACEKCHTNNVFAGTPQDCFSCHKQNDKHDGQLGTTCEACHSPAGWDQVHINHSLFAFPLMGAHVNAACETCHQNGVYIGTPQDCYSCHKKDEPHGERLGTSCATCHSTSAWKPASFDHNLSVFKLTGAHVKSSCTNCHQNGVFKGTPQDCYSCHQKNDNHKGQFGTSCATCHSTSAWKPASFDHNLSVFKLTGAHVKSSCTNCHQNGVFKGTPQNCYSCHQKNDNHKGQFGTSCASCHSTSTWKGATFDHNLAAFKLSGAHGGVACANCHQNGVYKGTPQACYSCHQKNDKHNGQFGTNCASCHSTSTWKGATFNHNLSGFPLAGRHVNLACERCHAGGQYSGTPSACVSCHSDPAFHAGMFGTNCSTCHSTSNWSATYHGSHPGIADEGGSGVNHGNTTCRTCHTSTLHSATCTACHDGNSGGDGGGGGGDDD